MADQKLSALSATCSVAAGDYLYTVLSPTTSPLQRHIAISDFENSLPNKITGANLGTGIGVYREKTNASLLFKTLVGGANVTLSSAASTVTISGASVAGEANTAVNLGTGIEVFREKSGVNLNLRTFIAGDNTTISSATSAVTISSTDTSNTAANIGLGVGVFRETVANEHKFKTFVSGDNTTISSAASTITISSTDTSNTATNLGTGIGVFKETAVNIHQFKTLVAGTNITLSSAASTVTISGASTDGEANTAVNLGTGIEIFREKSGVNLNLRTFIAGDNTTISSATSAVTISSTDTSNTAANLGAGGYGLFKETQANQHQFKTIVAGTNISLASAASTITITNSAAEAASTGHFTATIGASNTWNNELIPLWQAPRGGSATILEIDATTSGTATPILNFNLQIRNWDSMATAGTDVFAASQAATSAGEILTTLATSVLEPRSHLMFTTGSGAEGGSVNFITLSVYYTS